MTRGAATGGADERLSITYNGTSADYPQPIDGELSDRELRRIGEELVRSGDLPGLWLKDLPHRVFEQFVVDRIHSPKGGLRIYLRPKVPFGHGPARGARPGASQAGLAALPPTRHRSSVLLPALP